MKRTIKKLSILLLSLLFVAGSIPASVMAAATPSASYCTHVQNQGWQNYVSNGEMSGTSGKSLRLEGIKIKLDTQGYDLGVSYQTHIQNIGWEADTSRGWKSNDTMSGTTGLSYRLEAIQIKLTGADADKFDIYYQVHAQNIGWMGWAKNGESAGTAGYGWRLEGIRIKIVPAGSSAPGSTDNAFKEYVEPAYKTAYAGILDQAYKEFCNTMGKYESSKFAAPYCLFDMDNNGIPELIVKKGHYEANYIYNIYTYENGQPQLIGTVNAGHTVLYGESSTFNGQLILLHGQMLYQQVFKLYLNDGVISKSMILDGSVSSIDNYYKTNYPVPMAYAYDLSLLNAF